MSSGGGEHDLHVQECDGHRVRVEQIFSKDVVEVRRSEDLRAVRAAVKEVLEDAAE